jgi:hypothetical protein
MNDQEWHFKNSTDEWYKKGNFFHMTVYQREDPLPFLAAIWDPNTDDRWGVVHNDNVVDYRAFATVEEAKEWCDYQDFIEGQPLEVTSDL